jgi:N utilization substance protein B
VSGPLPGSRREARERALGLLYEAETKDVTPGEVLADLPAEPDPYAEVLARGVEENQLEIDELLGRFSKDWPVDRMPALDRAILRIATFELLCQVDVPTGAILNEAVELAGAYSTDDSSRFVNGLLARIAEEVRP